MAIWETTQNSLTVDTNIMAATDALGIKQGFKAPDNGVIKGIMLSDLDDDAFTANIWVFRSEPTGVATNAVFTLADADQQLTQAVVLFPASFDATNGQVRYIQTDVPYRTDGGVLWVQCALATGTPTFGAATDVTLKLIIEY